MAQTTFITSPSRLDAEDIKILNPTYITTPVEFGVDLEDVPYDIIQIHVYDVDGNYITSNYNLSTINKTMSLKKVVSGDGGLRETIFSTDPKQDLISLDLVSGTYKVEYVFLKYYLPSSLLPVVPALYIQDISTSRREIRVTAPSTPLSDSIIGEGKPINKDFLETQKRYLEDENPTGLFLLDFSKNEFSVIINQTVSGDSLLFKLYKPILDEINEKQLVMPAFEVVRPVSMMVTIENAGIDELPTHVLRGANTNILINNRYETGTEYQSWNDILSTNPQTSKDLLSYFLSSSNYQDTINVDYSDYNNFVHFSSAEERVKNFYYKLQLIEQYDASLTYLSSSFSSGSTVVTQNVNKYSALKQTLLNGFDGYEKWLYTESGSTYYSSLGFGEVTQSTWPKTNNTYPYALASTTSPAGISWYTNQLSVANYYDRENVYNLLKTVPFHIKYDEENNESYLTFLQMVGQHYDLLWTYIKYMTQKYDVEHKLEEGAAKDVIWDTMKSFGMDLTNGNDVTSLWKYAFGTDVTQSYANNIYQMSYSDATKEVWKRLFNNLPYLLKSKGTVRGIKALITCYGVPSTILRVKEYGGPEPDLAFESSKYISDEFTYQLNFDGTQQVSQSFDLFEDVSVDPAAIEFRFYVDPNDRHPMTLLDIYNHGGSVNDHIKLSVVPSYTIPGAALPTTTESLYNVHYRDLEPLTIDGRLNQSITSSGEYVTASGHILLEVSSSSGALPRTHYALTPQFPVYNKQYWSVLLNRTYLTAGTSSFSLWAKQASNGRISTQVSFSANIGSAAGWVNANAFMIGRDSASLQPFIGSMQEFRIWKNTLNEDVFNNHVLAPLAYNGNTYSSSYYDLTLRWRMNQSEFYTNGVYTSLILDSNPGQVSTHHGYWAGSNPSTVFSTLDETNYYESPSIGFRRMVSNKVRVDNYVSQSGNLSPIRRVTVSRFDSSPLDSNKVGIFLAPTEIINEDIIRTFAGVSYDDFIGNPQDQYKSSYPDLKQANDFYWLKYGTNPNIYTYMKALAYFDKSLYDQIRKMLPARVDANIGFLFEPHMLERPKIAMLGPLVVNNLYYTSSINFDDYIDFGASTVPISSALDMMEYFSLSSTTLPLSMSLEMSATENRYVIPILDMNVSNGVLNIVSSSFVWSATGSMVFPACDFWTNPMSKNPVEDSNGNIIGYSGSHFIFHRQYFTGLENLWYNGCLQTVDTTTDRGLPFESIVMPSTKLVVVDASEDKPRLKVE